MDKKGTKTMKAKTKTCPYCHEEIKQEAVKCRFCRSNLTSQASTREWYRDLPGRRFLGVASLMAVNTGLSVMIWRIAFILFTLYHGLGAVAYFVIWILTPFKQGEPSLIERLLGKRKYEAKNV
jgi:phage shock protein PspC (stress-responsive transcriptional regulator)